MYLIAILAGRSQQDKFVLRNTYNQLRGFNGHLKKEKRLEKLAQKHSCVRYHRDHKSTDNAAVSIYHNIESIIACVGGCSKQASNWSREKPASIWYEYRHQTNHFSAIKNNNRMGCSAAKKGSGRNAQWCVFCYLAKA